MSLSDMQAYLARLYVDDPLRQLFYRDPAAALAGYKLSTEERAALEGLDHTMLDMFARSLKNKRRGKFEAAYPLLFKLDAAEIARYYDRYCQLYPGRPDEPGLDQLLAFGRFMEDSLGADPDLPSWAGDLARYERMYCAVKFHPGVAGATPAPATPLTAASRPRLSAGVAVGTFGYDVLAVAAALTDGEIPGDPAPRKYYLVFQPGAAGAKPRLFAVNPPTRDLLEACDGAATVGQLVATTEQTLGKSGLYATVARILNHLLAQGTLEVHRDETGEPAKNGS